MTKKMTAEQVRKKYHDKYIEFYKTYDYTERKWLYEIGKVFSTIHENTTLGQDIETENEYRR